MKRNLKFTGILLMLFIAGNISVSAQMGNRGDSNNRSMNLKMASDTLRGHGMRDRNWAGPSRMDHMQRFNNDRGMYGMGRGMRPGGGFGMGRESRPMGREFGLNRRDSLSGRQFGMGRMMLESIPNVTEKQKKEISELMTKQREEMTKFRDEMQAKMKVMRESHRNSMLNILTDEQKKFIEHGIPKTPSAPAEKK